MGGLPHHILGAVVLREINTYLYVAQMRCAKGCAAGDPVEFAGAQSVEPVTVAEHDIADSFCQQRLAGLA